jgi:nucleoside-diphosphate-sugar epimerase
MIYLVTGGAGFIGHNVVKNLENLGHNPIIIDNFTDYGIIDKKQILFLKEQRLKNILSQKFDIDIRDTKSLEGIFQRNKIHGVIHLASFPRQKVVNKNPAAASEVMITALISLLELSKKYGISKFTYVSSSMVYGNFVNNVTENFDCKPQGQYGIMKYLGEKLVQDYTLDFDYTIVRPSAVYGEKDVEDRVISKFFSSAMKNEMIKVNGPNEVLDFTHVSDTADGITKAVLSNNSIDEIYNITRSDSKPRTLLEAAELIIKIVGKGKIQINDRDNDYPKRGILNIQKAKEDLNYQPKIDIEEGFKRYYDWLQSTI